MRVGGVESKNVYTLALLRWMHQRVRPSEGNETAMKQLSILTGSTCSAFSFFLVFRCDQLRYAMIISNVAPPSFAKAVYYLPVSNEWHIMQCAMQNAEYARNNVIVRTCLGGPYFIAPCSLFSSLIGDGGMASSSPQL